MQIKKYILKYESKRKNEGGNVQLNLVAGDP